MEQETIVLEKKKGLNLMMKILVVAVIPLILLVIISGFAIRTVGVSVSEKCVQHELNASTYALEQTLSLLSDGDWSYDGNTLYKGEYNVSDSQEFLDSFKEHTDVDVTIFWGTTRMATSIFDMNGNRVVGTEISDKVNEEVKKNGVYFTSDVVIEGKDYFGYYEALCNSDGTQIGVLFTGMESTSVQAIYQKLLRNNIAIMIIVAVVSCALIAVVMTMIVKAMTSMIHHLDDVANGDLSSAVSKRMITRSDEIGNIARALHSLIGGLVTIVKNIHSSAISLDDFSGKFQISFNTINESIHNVNTAVEEIANGATNQASEMQRVNEQISDMGNAITATTKNVDTLVESTEEMRDQNRKLDGTLVELVEISNRTRNSIDEVNHQTDMTNKSVMEIGSAVDMITDIASQTNLLSLNASIEAARAGEHGRGFAVVADEIRQLADQSSESAKKIGEIVEELIANSNRSVHTMNGVLTEINEQNEKLNATRDVFGQLNEEVGNVVVAIGNIQREIESVNQAKNDVMNSMDSLAAIAQENAASTEETSASMMELGNIVNDCYNATQELVDIADNMNDNVNRFQVK